MWPVPVAIDNVHPSVAVEISQRHAASVLVGVIQPWGAARGRGETRPPPCLCLPRMCPTVPRRVLPTQGCIPALRDALAHLSHPGGQWGSGSPGLSLHPALNQPARVGRGGQSQPCPEAPDAWVLPLLTHGSRHVPVRPIPPVVEEEIGAVLVTTEDVGGAVTQDGAHGHPTAPWGQPPRGEGTAGTLPQGTSCPHAPSALPGPPAPPPCPPPTFSPSHRKPNGPGSRLCHSQP